MHLVHCYAETAFARLGMNPYNGPTVVDKAYYLVPYRRLI